jgi:hypothetical protein
MKNLQIIFIAMAITATLAHEGSIFAHNIPFSVDADTSSFYMIDSAKLDNSGCNYWTDANACYHEDCWGTTDYGLHYTINTTTCSYTGTWYKTRVEIHHYPNPADGCDSRWNVTEQGSYNGTGDYFYEW